MPHPGDAVRKGEFKGETSKLHPDFVNNLRQIIPSILDDPESKIDVAGNTLSCSQLCQYFKVFDKYFPGKMRSYNHSYLRNVFYINFIKYCNI